MIDLLNALLPDMEMGFSFFDIRVKYAICLDSRYWQGIFTHHNHKNGIWFYIESTFPLKLLTL